MQIASGEELSFDVTVAARLDGEPELPIELIVDVYPVDTQSIPADGTVQDVKFKLRLEESSWVAIRSFSNAHTNPIYVVVDGKPVRGSIDSMY